MRVGEFVGTNRLSRHSAEREFLTRESRDDRPPDQMRPILLDRKTIARISQYAANNAANMTMPYPKAVAPGPTYSDNSMA